MDATSIFKFVTIRNASDKVTSDASSQISPNSGLVKDLALINASSSNSETKLKEFNARLQVFIDSPNFIKTQKDFDATLKLSGTPTIYNQLFDNIVARTITKSTTNKVYKLLVDQIKVEQLNQKKETIPDLKVENLKIFIPDSLIFSFISPKPNTIAKPKDIKLDLEAEKKEYAELLSLQSLINEVKFNNITLIEADGYTTVNSSKFSRINEKLGITSISLESAKIQIEEKLRSKNRIFFKSQKDKAEIEELDSLSKLIKEAQADGVQNFSKREKVLDRRFAPLLQKLAKEAVAFEDAENFVQSNLQKISGAIVNATPFETYVQVGNQYVNANETTFEQHEFDPSTDPKITDDAILVYSSGCWLKFPFQIADLRVVKMQTVGYLPGEIAHINNTQKGELHKRTTKRLKRTEEFLSLINEEEIFHETDTQSTEKLGFTKEAANVQSEESSWNVNASVSGSYGPIHASVDGGYENSSSSTDSNSFSQTYAKEIVQKVVDRTIKKIKQTRNTMTIEEFREKVTHVIDNTTLESKSIVYRWLTKLVRGTLHNYGKRITLTIPVAHPAHYYISRSKFENPKINIPKDPRSTESGIGQFSKINRFNYAQYATLYNVKIDFPPLEKIIVNEGFANKSDNTRKVEKITIPEGYFAVRGKFNGSNWNNSLIMLIAVSHQIIRVNTDFFNWVTDGGNSNNFQFSNYNGVYMTGDIKITFSADDYAVNFEIECECMPVTYNKWQMKAFQTLIEGYENLKSEAEAKMSEFNPNLPGLNPQEKMRIIHDELKKEMLRKMFRCNPFGIKDNFQVGVEYQSDCCLDSRNAEIVQFLESVFDWRNMTYELHPWLYASRDVLDDNGNKVSDNWSELLKLKDDDPHFQAFLQASYATVRLPIHRDTKKEIAAINFIVNNSIANYEVLQEGMQSLIDEMANEPVSKFTYTIDDTGQAIEVPESTSVDLGIFPLPTSLVLLECGVQDGVKPIGFDDLPENFKSPKIIADTCPK